MKCIHNKIIWFNFLLLIGILTIGMPHPENCLRRLLLQAASTDFSGMHALESPYGIMTAKPEIATDMLAPALNLEAIQQPLSESSPEDIAHFFDQQWKNLIKDYTSRIARMIGRYEELGQKILSLGAGQGNDEIFLAQHDPSSTVTAVDLSQTALEVITHKADQLHLNGQITTIQHDLTQEWPFPDNTFTLIFANQSLLYFNLPTMLQIFTEINRVSVPGASIWISVRALSDYKYQHARQRNGNAAEWNDGIWRFFYNAQLLQTLCLMAELEDVRIWPSHLPHFKNFPLADVLNMHARTPNHHPEYPHARRHDTDRQQVAYLAQSL